MLLSTISIWKLTLLPPDHVNVGYLTGQNNSYEITINGFQVRKINEIRNAMGNLPQS